MRKRPNRVWFITAMLVLFMFTTIGAVYAAENYGQIVSDIKPLLDRIENFEPEDCENGIALLEKITNALWLGINGNGPVLTAEERLCLNNNYKLTDETIKTAIDGGIKKYIKMSSSGGYTGYAGFLDAVRNNNLTYLSVLIKYIDNGTSVQAKNMFNYYGLSFADLMVTAADLMQVEYEEGLPVTVRVLNQYTQKLQDMVDRTEGKRTLADFAECGLTAANLASAVDQLSSGEKEQLESILDKLGQINHKPVAVCEPADGTTGVELEAAVRATFDLNVTAADLSGVKIEAGGVAVAGTVAALDGRVLTISHPDFTFLTGYTVTVPAGAVQSEKGVANDEIVWSFTTREIQESDKPVAAYEPTDGATGVELDAAVTATFDRDVTAADLSGVKIEAGGAVLVGVAVTLDGRVLNITHPDFAFLTGYTVTAPAGTVKSKHGVGNDEIVWSFTTREIQESDKPVAAYEPADG
ncbi:Ig-like domain-containing protein, partial [Candidatus Micrarchaeota archaeon]|nr:Ig-like domain-containing protein [Candidatus Micrarchaeota archaeon]